jgi:hypothetical protein
VKRCLAIRKRPPGAQTKSDAAAQRAAPDAIKTFGESAERPRHAARSPRTANDVSAAAVFAFHSRTGSSHARQTLKNLGKRARPDLFVNEA